MTDKTRRLLDLYTDYLLVSFGQATATGLSALLPDVVSHDKVTRFLSQNEFTSKDLWKVVKPHVRRVQSEEAVLIFDDSIEEKPYTDENEIITRKVASANFRRLAFRSLPEPHGKGRQLADGFVS